MMSTPPYSHPHPHPPKNVPRGVSIQVGPHVLNFRLEPRLGALLRSFEGHVLQEMGHAVVLRRLVATARINPNAH